MAGRVVPRTVGTDLGAVAKSAAIAGALHGHGGPLGHPPPRGPPDPPGAPRGGPGGSRTPSRSNRRSGRTAGPATPGRRPAGPPRELLRNKGSIPSLEVYSGLCNRSLAADADDQLNILTSWIAGHPSAQYVSDEDITRIARALRALNVGMADLCSFSDTEAIDLLKDYASREEEFEDLGRPGKVRRVALDSFVSARTVTSESLSPRESRRRSRTRTPPRPAPVVTNFDDVLRGMVATLKIKGASVSDGFDADQLIREFDEADRFDLASFKRTPLQGDASALDVNSFGDPLHISKAARERDRRKNVNIPYLNSSPTMEWQPRWLGSMLAPSERSNHRRNRMKGSPHSAASLCNSAVAFWLSHAALGQVQVVSVFAHLLVLLRLVDERGLDLTHRYQSLLHQECHTRIAEGEEFSLDLVISKIDHNQIGRAHV